MPAQGAIRGTDVGLPAQRKGGYATQVFNELASTENRSVVIAVTFFVAGVAFLTSSLSEVLLPPL